jgi:hypothetical protein
MLNEVKHLVQLPELLTHGKVTFPAGEILTGTARQRMCRFTQDDERQYGFA